MIEYALSFLPFHSVTIQTPQGIAYEGKCCQVHKICGVSILRAGETMEAALTDVCKDIRIGKILIQTSSETGEPGLYYLRLPKDIKDSELLLSPNMVNQKFCLTESQNFMEKSIYIRSIT